MKGVRNLPLVVDTIENHPSAPLQYTYDLNDPIRTKVQKVAQKICTELLRLFIRLWPIKIASDRKLGYFPIIRSVSPRLNIHSPFRSESLWGPMIFELKVRDVIINNGAEMIVCRHGRSCVCRGSLKEPQARKIDIVDGMIED